MAKDTFQSVIDDNRLMFEYVRGSHLYGLNNEDSDIDMGGIYIAKESDILGLGLSYQEQLSDERHDKTWYEIGKFAQLIRTSNPTVLEALFVPKDKMVTPPCAALMPLFENRDAFITKQCFNPFVGYAKQQISKARGLNKKIVNPVTNRLTAYDFAYTFRAQGSSRATNWLEHRGLNKDFCGLVCIPNMHDAYGVFYDWGAHFKHYEITLNDIFHTVKTNFLERFKFWNAEPKGEKYELLAKNVEFISDFYGIKNNDEWEKWFKSVEEPLHYRGMCLEGATNLRCSSVAKGENPICHIIFNESGFIDHCKKYKEYQEWVEKRNPKRYESNLNKNYDSKNMMHCVRLMHMGKEIAEGRGINLVRTEDREFLMDIRNHKYEYDDLMAIIDKNKEELDDAIAKSNIRETIDSDLLDSILIDIRKKYYNS